MSEKTARRVEVISCDHPVDLFYGNSSEKDGLNWSTDPYVEGKKMNLRSLLSAAMPVMMALFYYL